MKKTLLGLAVAVFAATLWQKNNVSAAQTGDIRLRCQGQEGQVRIEIDTQRRDVITTGPHDPNPDVYQDGRVRKKTEQIGILWGGHGPNGEVNFQYSEKVTIQPQTIEFIRQRKDTDTGKILPPIGGQIDRETGELSLSNLNGGHGIFSYQCSVIPSKAQF